MRTGVACRISRLDPVSVKKDRATTVFRILQDAMAEARSSQATNVVVALERTDRNIQLIVDSEGFLPTGSPPESHVGILRMRERAAQVGGTLSLETRHTGGNRLVVQVPLGP